MCGMELLRFRSVRRNRRLGGSCARKVKSSKFKGQSAKDKVQSVKDKVQRTKFKVQRKKDKRDKW